MPYAEVKLHVELLRRRRSWASRLLLYTAKWIRTRSMCKWYDFPCIWAFITDSVQADEAYCVGPAPSAESYVSGHASSKGEFSTPFSYAWILSLTSRRGVVHRLVISLSERLCLIPFCCRPFIQGNDNHTVGLTVTQNSLDMASSARMPNLPRL
jgi:hypothetical protein